MENTLQLRPSHVEAFVKTLSEHRQLGRRLGNWTIGRRVQEVRRILAISGVDAGFFNSVELPEAGQSSGRESFTDDELRSVMKVFSDDKFKCPFKTEMKAAHLIGLNTGMRLKDVCLLERASVDFERGLISLTPCKTKRFNRSVSIPLSDELASALHEAKAWKAQEGEYVLPGVASRYLDSETAIAKTYSEILKAASIKTSIADGTHRAVPIKGFHSLRHTFISRFAERVISPFSRLLVDF